MSTGFWMAWFFGLCCGVPVGALLLVLRNLWRDR